MKQIITIISLLIISTNAFSYYPTVRNFKKEAYRSGAQNWSIAQGEGGNMWFANSGILEFDGNEWTVYQTINQTSARSVMYDSEMRRMYFGATDEFGYMHIDTDNRMKYVSLKDSLQITLGEIWSIHKFEKGLWLRENQNMYLYDFESIKQFSFNDKVAISTVIDGKMTIFVNNIGVLQISPEGSFKPLYGTEGLKDKGVNAMIPYGQDIIFVTATEGLYRFSNGTLYPYDEILGRKLKEDNVYCAASNGKYISFGTVKNGVYIKDLDNNTTIHLNTYSGLQNNTVLSMYYDTHDNLWLGLDKGIDLIELGSAVYRMFGNPNEFGTGYASEIFEDKLWLGTNQGLYATEYSEGSGSSEDYNIREINAVKGQVWSLMEYDGHLFCCNDKGIHTLKNGKVRHIPMNGAWKLEKLKEYPDHLLGCSYDRLFLLRKNGSRWQFEGWLEGFDSASKVFVEDRDGKIWFSHWINGLYRLTVDIPERKITEVEYFSKSNGFPEDWSNIPINVNDEIIFSTTAGFYCYDSYNQQAYRHERINSLFGTPPTAGTHIHLTPQKDFFFSSGNMQAFCYHTDDGFIVDSLSLRHLVGKRILGFEEIRSLTDKNHMVNTEDGFSIIRTDVLKERRRVTLNDVYIKSIHITQSTGDSTIFSSRMSPESAATEITLPYRNNSLKFSVILPAYTSGTMARYRFMLENYDTDWSQYGEVNTKEYTRLPSGKYTFKVQAKTPDSNEVSAASIAVTIKAPWYMTAWAFIAYIIVLIAIIYACRQSIRHIMNVRAMQLEKQNEEEIRKRKMQLELEHKAQDLAESTMNVIRKNEILLDIDNALEKVAEYIAEDRNKSLKALSRIRHEIKENIQHDDLWKRFEENFDIVYSDFLKRLTAEYPNLSVTDKKMCAYLKMDLNSKEIAPLLNITVRSVEMTRYRLRKKLGLSREDNLTEFLQNF